jgi:FkbM family methyltransferase
MAADSVNDPSSIGQLRITKRRLPFVLVSTAHGALIMSRLDMQPGNLNSNQIFEDGIYEPFEVSGALDLLELRRNHYGDGVFAIDCGANIGVHTIEWSKLMTNWGWILSIEAQVRLYYALAGNVALNNCFNVQAINAAVGKIDGIINIPKIDYFQPARYGSLELQQRDGTEFIGQSISYEQANLVQVRALRLDSLKLDRLDLIKIDVEGMEIDTLEGATNLLMQHKPLLIIEIINSDQARLSALLNSLGYNIYRFGRLDILAAHQTDKTLPDIAQRDWAKETV